MFATMLTSTLFALAILAGQSSAAPAPTLELVARQGYDPACTATYSVKSGDTCSVIRDKFEDVFSLEEFYAWNPQVDEYCSNLYPDDVVCVGMEDTPQPGAPCPVPFAPGLVSNCAECYEAVEFDNCYKISEQFDVTLDDLHLWNPSLNAACTNLLVDYHYCVGI